MLRSTQRILTTHTGSLPRPEALSRLYIDRGQGKPVDLEELARSGREATRTSIRSQADAGIDIGNNGEQPRDSFFLYLRDRLTGLGGSWERPTRADVERYPAFKKRWAQQSSSEDKVSNVSGVPMAVGEVSYIDRAAIDQECSDLEAAVTENPGAFLETFMSSPSPGIVASALRNEYYDTLEDYLEALGKALQIEYETIVEHGFILQIDAPDLAMERHVTYKDKPLSVFLEFVEMVVAVINRSLVNVPRDRVRLHVCWGNSESPHDSDVSLADILPAIMKADVGGFVLPFANPRHAHEYKYFADHRLADDQILVAGVIDTLTNFVEHPEVVADRLERVATVVGDPTRVLAGTDCGFDTSAGWGRVAEDVVWAKLRAMGDGAELATKRLY
ncbi:MAG TPA: cobalamin-independent methionine synthase II family protein [Acidimicrobiia bacterium]|nr:cobalamin-independent methionine synthase II family protein [Acidimicrobiia bacterium]